jgi:hypothetical protein
MAVIERAPERIGVEIEAHGLGVASTLYADSVVCGSEVEYVRADLHAGAVEAMREIAEELDLLSGGRVEGRYLAGVAARLRAAAGGTAEQSGTRSAHESRESRA